MVLNEKQRQIGKDNFGDAAKISRRQVLTGALAIPTAASIYWGYDKLKGNPVRTGLIGTGNQGCYAHISQSNPDYIDIVAISDIRPSNQERARKLLNEKYGAKAKDVKLYVDYMDMINDPDIELIIVALPLHLHKHATIEAMKAGKHVLCEKLMAKTVEECKEMVRAADETKKLLSIGHQRHYSYLYANALSIMQQGILGDVRAIRAFWHRNQTAGGAEGAKEGAFDSWRPGVPAADRDIDYAKFGYVSLEQLIQWRLDNRTGGGLMVELGSHQLDAISIFLNKAHPQSVQGIGKVSFFNDGRDVFDHVHLLYDFGEDANNTVVGYSSICTNAFDVYGEQVMGTKGTMIIQAEQNAYLFKEGANALDTRVPYADYLASQDPNKDTHITWAEQRLERPTMDSGSTAAWASGIEAAETMTSRGYREEQEHLAWLIRNPDAIQLPSQENPMPKDGVPRCHGRIALIDAAITLASNLAMEKKKSVEFKPEWFDPYSPSVPENEV
ncbi:MAG: Gfo/Idh/MocA family oxidoreductase [Phycisphaerales bacterium]|nr:Gfo/Idh/MocA family oxidoreductase [Phycisphaerales bacterium]